METTTERTWGGGWLVWVVVLGGLWLALTNVPAPSLSGHALEKHGQDAERVMQHYDNGDCTRIYRNVAKNRVIYVVGQGPFCGGVIMTCSGKPVTSYPAPKVYWDAKVVGYDFVGHQGACY